MALTCSICEEPLIEAPRTLRCRSGHSFDITREGYVNLLAAKDIERGIAGDTAEMLRARRRFLDTHHFSTLLETVNAEVAAALEAAQRDRACVVEAGCGEGYYIGNSAGRTAPATADVRFIGFDVSKFATRLAARRYKAARFAVANVRRRLYVQSGSVSVLLSVFAPRNVAEFRRVLASDGTLIIVIPSPSHMRSVRERYQLLRVEETKEERLLAQLDDHFTLESRQPIEYPMTLTPEQIHDFIGMGPSAHHRERALAPEQDARTVASFVLLRLRG